mgnify:CR=1 FL=1
MKWAFIILIALNLVILTAQWLNKREIALLPEYEKSEEGKEIVLLKERGLIAAEGGLCDLLGPIKHKKEADHILSGLDEDASLIRKITKEKVMAPGYWVYLEVSDDNSAASELVKLKAKNIDSFVIISGKLKGHISLGVFENIDLAKQMVKDIAKNDIILDIAEIMKKEKEYWLLLPSDYAAENKEKFDEILASTQYDQEMRQISCKSVASEK